MLAFNGFSRVETGRNAVRMPLQCVSKPRRVPLKLRFVINTKTGPNIEMVKGFPFWIYRLVSLAPKESGGGSIMDLAPVLFVMRMRIETEEGSCEPRTVSILMLQFMAFLRP